MTPEEAVAKLREAGLHVRDLGEDGILGGSHVDRSGFVGMVQNGFLLKRVQDGSYEIDLLAEGGKLTLPLESAVDEVIHRIKPQPDIEAPPPPPGPRLY